MDAAAVLIPPRLCHCYIFKMNCKNPGRKKLPVRDLTALLEDQLFYFFMIHSCQRVTSFLVLLYRPAITAGGKNRFQNRGAQCFPILLIRGCFAQDGIQS